MHLPDWINAIILGIVEGLTEFLPVSSTGHLFVVSNWLHFNKQYEEVFNVFIQIGALSAVWWLFRQRLVKMIPIGPTSTPEGRRLCCNVLLGFVPLLAVGFLTRHLDRSSVLVIAWATLFGGIVILFIEKFKKASTIESLEAITPKIALAIGIAQCLSLCPGVSRSGATIMAGLVLGLSRPVVTEFTFLLAVPTLLAAAGWELLKYRSHISETVAGLLAIGFVVSFLVAFVVVKWLIRFVQNHTFNGFAWYRIVAGTLLLILLSKGFFAHS
jgi:undecaprenyl-diphosphatase